MIQVGDKIKIGKKYAKQSYGRFKENQMIELIEGTFFEYNGLYDEAKNAPSIWNEEDGEYDSIYHLFGNNFENFMDCKIIHE